MNYSEHSESIKLHFPELDLLKENEFHLFKNEDFAIRCINSCIDLCNNAKKKLKITLNFGVRYDNTFNAKAIVKDKYGVILLNLGLIESIESIVSDSIEIFSKENIAVFTIPETDKVELKNLFTDLCYSYVFYHELAHILQMFNISSAENYNFQEQYSVTDSFNIKNHIYELDADLFGVSMSTIKLLVYAKDENNQFNSILLFNLLTALLFSISNIIILFSENQFKTIYYKNYSHPHPMIRIIECNDQILNLVFKNLQIPQEFFLAILQRTITMINQIDYINKGLINYTELFQENFLEMEAYINEIGVFNESYPEITRFRSQEILNCLIY